MEALVEKAEIDSDNVVFFEGLFGGEAVDNAFVNVDAGGVVVAGDGFEGGLAAGFLNKLIGELVDSFGGGANLSSSDELGFDIAKELAALFHDFDLLGGFEGDVHGWLEFSRRGKG